MVMRFASSELEAGDLALREIDFAADQSMWPGGIKWEGVSQQGDLAVIVRAADVDHGPLELPLGIESPLVGGRRGDGERPGCGWPSVDARPSRSGRTAAGHLAET